MKEEKLWNLSKLTFWDRNFGQKLEHLSSRKGGGCGACGRVDDSDTRVYFSVYNTPLLTQNMLLETNGALYK